MWAKMIYMISMEFVYVLNYYLMMCPPLLSPFGENGPQIDFLFRG